MKQLIFSIFFFGLTSLVASAQVQSHNMRYSNETSYDFASRNRNNPEKVTDLKWNNHNVIIANYKTIGNAYYNEDLHNDDTTVTIDLYVAVSSISCIKVAVPSVTYPYGNASVESVFLANADKDAAEELFIILSWKSASDKMEGTMYQTFVYDDLPTDYLQLPASVKDMEIASQFSGCDCKRSGQPATEAEFKTSADIRANLKKRGFKQ